jgi:hypothetical protein
MVSFTHLPLYPKGKNPRYALERRLGGPRAALNDREKLKFMILPELQLLPLGSPALSQSLYHYATAAHKKRMRTRVTAKERSTVCFQEVTGFGLRSKIISVGSFLQPVSNMKTELSKAKM